MFIKAQKPMATSISIVVMAVFGLLGCGAGSNNPSSSLPNNVNSSSSAVTEALSIAPNDVRIRYTGRVSLSADEAVYDWPNTQIEFRTNAPLVELKLEDGNNDYNIFIDNQLSQVLSTKNGVQRYALNLPVGDHHVLLTKRTGSNFGVGRFLGFNLPNGGQLLELPAPPIHKIEFIGDSYTVGYGNEGPGLDCAGNLRPYENSFLSYAPISARVLGAQSHSIAVSGKGAVRNYGDINTTSPDPVPTFYNRTLATRSDLLWNFTTWVPDAVVIKLGTNDHSTDPIPSSETFIQGIHDLIRQVNNAYGQLPLFLLADSSSNLVMERLQRATQEQVNMGNIQVHFVQVEHPPQSQLGCDWHPKVEAHEAMAAQLVKAIKPILSWPDENSGSTNLKFAAATAPPFVGMSASSEGNNSIHKSAVDRFGYATTSF